MKTPSTRRPLRVFSNNAAVEKRSANHVDVEDEQSVAVSNLDDNFRMPLDFFINARRTKERYNARISRYHLRVLASIPRRRH